MSWGKSYDFFNKYKVVSILLITIVTIILGYYAAKTEIDMGTYSLLPQEDEVVKEYNQISNEFGGFDNLILLVKDDSDEVENKIEDLVNDLNELDWLIQSIDYNIPKMYDELVFANSLSLIHTQALLQFAQDKRLPIEILSYDNSLEIFHTLLNEEEKLQFAQCH